MRNSIIFKFIAITLCAVSLLGMIGGLAGIVALIEGDLYQKNLADVKAERIQVYASQYADDLARMYASTSLGNMPEAAAEYGSFTSTFRSKFPSYGYAILDAEGTILSQYNEALKDTATLHTFSADGQYMHLVSTEPMTQNTEPVDYADTSFYEAEAMEFPIPQEGVEVNSIFMYDINGEEVYQAINLGSDVSSRYKRNGDNAYHIYSDAWNGKPVGFMGYDDSGRLYYLSYLTDVAANTVYPQHEVAYINLTVNDEETYQLGPMGTRSLGSLQLKNGYVYFRSHAAAQEAATPAIVDRSTISLGDSMDVYKASFYGQNGNLIYEAQLISETQTSNDQTHQITRAQVRNAMAGTQQSSSYTSAEYSDPVGLVSYDSQGTLYYASLLYDADQNYPSREVSRIYLQGKDNSHYLDLRTFDIDSSLGTLEVRNGTIYFRSNIQRPAQTTEPQPSWQVETIPNSDSLTIIMPDGTRTEVSLSPQAAPTEAPVAEETAVPEEPPTEAPITDETVSETQAETLEETEESAEESTASAASAMPEATLATEAALEEDTSAAPETAETLDPALSEEDASQPETLPQETIPTATEPPETAPTLAEETLPPETQPVTMINGKPLSEYQINTRHYWDQERQEYIAKYVYLPMPELTVELYLDETQMSDNLLYDILQVLWTYHNYLLPLIGICALVFAIFSVYLCTAAGRRPKTDEIRAGGLNRIPLDLYLCTASFLVACFLALAFQGTPEILRRDAILGCTFAVSMAFLSCLLFVAFCFAFVAQVKTPGGFWWRNTLCGHFFRLTFRFAAWVEYFCAETGFPWLGRTLRKLWNLAWKALCWICHTTEQAFLWCGKKLGKLTRWLFHKLHRFLSLLPLTWQWLLGGLVLLFIGLLVWANRNDGWGFVWLLLGIGLVMYLSHCFGLLSESTKRMSKGDLDTKVEDKLLIGCFKDFSNDLNNLADVAVVAAQKQLKSERMKTELITNVSHDIKTPLTSIINYVDLLQKPHTPEEQAQYLEVLDRQSQRLKKLIDDLMDMSKANTGNMQVDITRLDAVESVNQALGEFADKLDRARLIPVFRHDQSHVPMMADGRLVWRVLSNLLSNAVKYAMPGTRLYIDLMTLEGKVIISLKNISREELNVDADELMERFVRGDDSRNTEGSGLGLNIAKSLMELQKGQLQLLVDGDLFKVTLVFPGL